MTPDAQLAAGAGETPDPALNLPAPGPNAPVSNPYVGPRAFDEAEHDLFFGRDEEIAILVGQVMARRVSLFFAQSGAGKSSLLRAGLVPELTRQVEVGQGRRRHRYQKMRVLPILRVSGGAALTGDPAAANPYLLRALMWLLPTATPAELAATDLPSALAAWLHAPSAAAARGADDGASVDRAPADAPAQPPPPALLIFDQFEEIFDDAAQSEARVGFFRAVAAAVMQLPDLHVLFTMREDYIAELVPYAPLLPDELRHRFRMERLRTPAARLAVQEPAAAAGRPFAPGVAEALVDNLRRTRTRARPAAAQDAAPAAHAATASHAVTAVLGDYVEPVHLQIVCRQLWESLPPDGTRIEAGDVQAFGDVDQALQDFYTRILTRTVARSGISERRVRDWFNRQLITPAQTRGLVYRGVESTEGLPNAVVDLLRDAYLIRADLRGDDVWYQLTHDRLVEPILAANRVWFERYENPLAALTARWLAAGRSPDVLLQGAGLAAAADFAAANAADLTEDERAFLDESARDARRVAAEAAAVARRRRIWAVTAILTILVLAGLSVLALRYARRAEDAAALARAQTVIAEEQTMLARQETARAQRNEERANAEAARANAEAERANAAAERAREQEMLARSRQIASNAMANLATDPERSVLLALAALDLGYSDEAARALGEAVQLSRVQAVLYGHVGPATAVGYAPDGRLLISAGDDGRIALWDTTTVSRTALLDANALVDARLGISGTQLGGVNGLALSRDGALLATAHDDGTALIWDLPDGTLRHVLQGHGSTLFDAAFSPDGALLATAGADRLAIVWDVAAGLELYRLDGHASSVMGVAFSPDGAQLATAGDDRAVRLWDVAGGALQGELTDFEDALNAVAYSPDGRRLAVAGWDRTARLYDAATLQPLATLIGHTNGVGALRFNPTGTLLATGSYDGSAIIWDVLGARQLLRLAGHQGAVDDVAFNQDGMRLATAGADGAVRIWDSDAEHARADDELLAVTIHDEWLMALAQDATGARLAVGDRSGRVTLWDTEGFSKTLDLQTLEAGRFNALDLNAAGTRLATVGTDRQVQMWNAVTGRKLWAATEHNGAVQSVAFAPDGDRLATADVDGTVIVWGAEDGALLVRRTDLHRRPVNAVAFSADGAVVLTASVDGTAKMWDPATGAVLLTLDGHDDWVYDAVMSHDGTLIATAGGDGTARLWDAVTGAPRRVLADHFDDVTGVAFSPGDDRLVSISRDGTAKIWDVATGRLERTIAGSASRFRDVLFASDDRYLYTAGQDDTLRVHYLQLAQLMDLARQRVTRTLTPEECVANSLPEDCGDALRDAMGGLHATDEEKP